MIAILILSSLLNLTWSPDSSRVAFTKDNDLYVACVSSRDTTRLTFDGSATTLNGYASWVYYEEIFGRSGKYRAFWWSPDSKKIAYYSFDDSAVPMFPIYSPFGQEGAIRATRYPKAGRDNPSVKVRIADLPTGTTLTAFEGGKDEYFGTPFWSADSKELYVSRMPRRQSRLEVYAVNAIDASSRKVYYEEYPTWINWIEGMLFTDDGLYMARDFQSGWEQIYFLPFDGSGAVCLTLGRNWDISLLKVDSKLGMLWFTARRDSRLHPSLYRMNLRSRKVTMLSDPSFWVKDVKIADDGSFTAKCSNACTPWFDVQGGVKYEFKLSKGQKADFDRIGTAVDPVKAARTYPNPQVVRLENDGFDLWGLVNYPKGFDMSKKYPVVIELYGGPGTAYVRDRWQDRDASNKWCWENGVIYMVVDPRSSGENGRRGLDEAFKRMTVIELQDYIAWARHLCTLPYVDSAHIGVDGFSFGGTTTAMLVLRYPEYFHCGIAGGGVYDWTLYDTHYTERFMCTPLENPDGYTEASVMHYVDGGLTSPGYLDGHLRLTHGTGDDNVHFQNTLLLTDALQRRGIQFELMVYPDGMHGYRGAQHTHDAAAAAAFWKKYLFD